MPDEYQAFPPIAIRSQHVSTACGAHAIFRPSGKL